jgi:sugar fermentation stimulation protein A
MSAILYNCQEFSLMRYSNVIEGIFLKRPNRFIAHVMINGREETAHVKNTGRCRELLIPGVKVYLQQHDNPSRKTKFSLIAVQKEDLLVNIDSQAPNKVVMEVLTQKKRVKSVLGLMHPVDKIRQESVYGSSRFDFQITAGERQAFLEIKGVTLEQQGVAMFPDAPTERGVRHVRELQKAVEEGFLAYVVFIVQMQGIRYVTPNDQTHMEFGQALREAESAGVKVLAYDCLVAPDELRINHTVPVKLQP